MNKKIILGLGAVATLVTPIVATISCSNDKSDLNNKDKENLITYKNDDLTIDVRIPDFAHELPFDEATYDSSKYIQEWFTQVTGIRANRQIRETHNMIPYVIDREIKLEHSNAQTLGDLLDEINAKGDKLFEFNQSKEEAGSMGRFLYGIKKGDKALSTISDIEHEGFWGIHWTHDAYGWKQDNDDDYSYISLSSPNNAQAVKDSHNGFDHNESRHYFDGRLPKGVDGINVASHDIYYLNLWKMI